MCAFSVTGVAAGFPLGITRDPNPGILYVTSSNNCIYQIAQNSGVTSPIVTGLTNPSGAALDSTSTHLVIGHQGGGAMVSWALGAGAVTPITNLNSAPGAARDVTIDSSGNMCVADTPNNRILFFPAGQTTGRVIAGTGAPGNGDNKLSSPSANSVIVAGGNGQGSEMNQLNYSWDLCIDDDKIIYIADYWNHHNIEWQCGATTGRVVAGGNGQGNLPDQLSYPPDVIIDKKNILIICDGVNNRVFRWPRQNGTNGKKIISNIGCHDSTIDGDGFLYIVVCARYQVTRYRMEVNQGTVVAGGHGLGSRLDQLNYPRYVFVDRNHSVYVWDE
ncbi:unnamed protein product [Rotaria sp. Silwood1]|nr:unnamed protein product [Rotaria sp. Silwood1]CAF3529669.1 unnamed protein product [Rotaria sp. Silwood1]CAF4519418.1 unnamed protein product [Rotaria sp. Silwood1]